jgi:glutamate racemase
MMRADSICLACRHFENDAAVLERALPGIAVLSSARAASRADDGLCRHHDRHVPATARCTAFAPIRSPG